MIEQKGVFPREQSNIIVKKFTDLGMNGRIDLLLMHYIEYKCKSNTTDEQKEILNYLFSTYYPRLEKGGEDGREIDLVSETLGFMEEKGLIYSFEDLGCINYKATAEGCRINEEGGWLKHIKEESELKKIQRELTMSSLLKNWWWLIASAIALGVGIGKYLIK